MTSTAPARTFLAPTLTFVLLTFVASGALLQLQPASGIDPAVLALVQLGPAVGAGITLAIFRGRLAPLLPDAVPRRQVVAHLVLALAACLLYAGVLVTVLLVQGEPLEGAHGVAGVPFVVLTLTYLVGAAGEEIGWRGMLQPLLENRFSLLAASIVTGLVWGVWHVQIFTAGPVVVVAFLLATVALSVLVGHFGRGTVWQRVALATLVHWLVNLALLLALGDRHSTPDGTVANAIAALVTTAVFMAMFAAAQRKRGKSALVARRTQDVAA
ncbi:CPBP family intramembrane metalloprotease [Oerskovia sp. Sa1BUA8]|uniref:CPBP family intramembrane metalloprotease n=1 Tax=Oerskovia douganii TaxID=2762210 RepID=A0A9D5UC07_9CELL|nr:type II CAAX endopeptidase family protein [Oerskovia douganii]MBE7701564.1 CPBP family intramembrane metalloprotease [Oerskovia douganii]